MGKQPPPEDWEQVIGSDLVPHLVPAGQHGGMRRPADVAALPPGAHQDLAAAIGRHGLEDLLIVPAAAWPCGGVRRRCLYTPLCVLGAGDRAAGLWVQSLPEPGIRAVVPYSEIAAVEQETDGPQRRLIITGRVTRLLVRYYVAGGMPAGTLTSRLRHRAAGEPAPVPGDVPRSLAAPHRWRHLPDPAALRLAGDEFLAIGRRSRLAGREILLSVTSRELIIATSVRAGPLWRARLSRTLYIPRRQIEDAGIRSGTLRLRSAGRELSIGLGPGRLTAAASLLLGRALDDHDRSGTSS